MLTSAEIHEFLPKWREAKALALGRRSMIVYAPRYYGKKTFLRSVAEGLAGVRDSHVLHLSSNTLTPSQQLDFPKLWQLVLMQLDCKSRTKITDPVSFESALWEVALRLKRRVHVNLSGCGRGNAIHHNHLVGLFNNLLLEDAMRQHDLFSVIAIDDYSLFHHIIGKSPESDTAEFEKLHVSTMTAKEISDCMRLADTDHVLDNSGLKIVSEVAFSITGGHLGLIAEFIYFALTHLKNNGDIETIEAAGGEFIRRSHIIEGLSAALREDPLGLSHTALEYTEPSTPEALSPRIQILRELGILVRDWPSSKLVLAKGVITELVREVSEGRFNTLSRVGTILTEFGPRVFEAHKLDIQEDDFVVVLLADLHCSEDQYRYALNFGGREVNRGKASLVRLLKEDFLKLEIVGRIDILVIAGDIAGNGRADEYDRAESVLAELLSELALDVGRVVVIPGNHDLDWSPGAVAVTEPNRAVTKEGYLRFLRLLGKKPLQPIDAVSVRSRSGRKVLSVIGFDSNAVEGPNAGGIGYVSSAAFEAAEKQIGQIRSKETQDSYMWLAVHHHVYPANNAAIHDAEKKKVSVLANSSELQSRAIRWSAEVIMHGHEHQPSVTVARTWPVEEGRNFAPLVVVGAGSVSAQRELLGEFSRNQYFVLFRREKDVVIRSRCMGDHGTGFVPHGDLIVPLSPAVSKV